jgi:filamentous hemagglutinin family protein
VGDEEGKSMRLFGSPKAQILRQHGVFISFTGILVLWSSLILVIAEAFAQVTATPGPGSLGTVVNQVGSVYEITLGTHAGSNIFHSFGDFNTAATETARFQTTTLIPDATIGTILGRVTGGSPSSIFGTIDSISYYPNANLFLMNPNGILFGAGAQINVGGMAHFTTADYLRLNDAVRFEAMPNAQDVLLSTASVNAFGFLGSNPAAIAVQGTHLTLANGTGLSLVGGNRGFTYTDPDTGATASVPDGVTITEARLSASSGQINLASVASPGEILSSSLQTGPNINGQSFTNMGTISISQNSLVDVSSDAAGTIRIRGGQFVMANSTLAANTGDGQPGPVAIEIALTGDMSISDSRGLPALSAQSSGTGNAGEIRIESANLNATSSFSVDVAALIDTHTSGIGRAGNVSISTGDLQVAGTTGNFFFIDSGTAGPGNGGDVAINASNVQIGNANISTGDFVARSLSLDASGSGGNVTMTGTGLELNNAIIDTSAFTDPNLAGNVAINVDNIRTTGAFIGALGFGGGGAITVNTDTLIMDRTTIETDTVSGPGGGISVTARVVELRSESGMVSTTFGDGKAGDIQIVATDHMRLSSTEFDANPTGLFSNSTGDLGSGDAGAIVVTTPRLDLTGGARINTTTLSSGRGGDVTLNVSNRVSISGEFPTSEPEPIFGIGTIHPSGIFTKTAGSDLCSGPCGDAGRISLTTGSLVLGNGAQIDSGTSNNGHGGDITIHAANSISMSGTLTDGSPVGVFSRTIGADPGSGAGGTIALTAEQSITMTNGAAVSSSSSGPGNTGNIEIDAGNLFTMTNSSVTTEATQASGGAIKITTNPGGTVQLTNSMISASVLDGAGGGGSVNIDPQYVILLNSQILANAVQGPGGNISITTNFLLPDAYSTISASSQFGTNGTITIQSPNAPVSGQIQPLGKTPLIATSLLNQHCAALAGGQFSSFTVAGRDSLPTEPGSWLASPLAMLSTGTGEGLSGLSGLSSLSGLSGVVRAGLVTHQTDQIDKTDQPLLSLRQIAPAGFLTQTFAVDQSASCQS